MNIKNHKIKLQTKECLEFIDVTDEINKTLKQHGPKEGLVNIQSLHTTLAVFVNENEPLLLKDMKSMLERIAPRKEKYHHDNFDIRTVNMCDDECDNGHSHCKALHLPTAQMVNIIGNQLQLGTWQRVFALELDRARPRELALQMVGL